MKARGWAICVAFITFCVWQLLTRQNWLAGPVKFLHNEHKSDARITNGLDEAVSIKGLQLEHIFHRNLESGTHGRYDIPEELSQVAMAGIGTEVRAKHGLLPKYLNTRSIADIEHEWKASISKVKNFASSRANPANWHVLKEEVPDITDKATVVTLAKIAANAYVPTPYEGDWSNVSHVGWDIDDSEDGFGWMEDGVRGYVFASADRKTIIISYKGTSAAVVDDGGPTSPNDKINDNLFFSCCCARISYAWSTVCDCYLGGPGSRCDELCLEQELWRQDRYYRAALDVYFNATSMYPESTNVWVVGHSLGGALSSLIGRTFGLPAVTYQAPGDQLAARRLHLPAPPGIPIWDEHVWHVGHTADPIFMGSCNGASSTCWLRGYAMETKCHSGQVCIYDIAKDKGWYSTVANHRIHVVIDDVLEAYDDVAQCVRPAPCEDCSKWTFEDPFAEPEPGPEPEPDPAPVPTSTSTRKSKSTDVTSTEYSTCVHRAWYGRCDVWTTAPRPTETTGPFLAAII